MKKKIVGSYPYTNVLFSISAALFMIALFALFALGTSRLAKRVASGIEMQVVLENKVGPTSREAIVDQIVSMDFISENDPPQFISKEEAAEIMIESTGEDFVRFLGDNPLRDAYAVRVGIDIQDDEALEIAKKQLQEIEGVYEVVYTSSVIRNVRTNMRAIGSVVVVLSLIFFATAIILINNSIRLALFSQRFLIRSMQLVGATQMFIKKPFLIRGALQGAVGGTISSIFIAVVSASAFSSLPQFTYLISSGDIWFVCLLSIILGTLVVVSSVYFSISKYLKMKLDDLY
ncbi:permease-like cell division protein FtsX [Flammeovirga sp. SubArs3]|uniref:cell division protein FtsX n=1 Tax=Flammeovirga sp. SubArs3 TaxID=2995316 RepID=UPI00248B2A4B|nr:permease-like cell division protein FtsX [Flammeovirga sp. SubArs3]